MNELICLKCPEAKFLNPQKEICYRTGGLYCERLQIIVGKFDPCHAKDTQKGGSKGKRPKGAKKES